MPRAIGSFFLALCLLAGGAAHGQDLPEGDSWAVFKVYADGSTAYAGEALLIDSFSGPVTFVHFMTGAEKLRLATPDGSIDVTSYRAADPLTDLVVLDAEIGGTLWQPPEAVTVESSDTLWVTSRVFDVPAVSTTGGVIEVPPGLQMIHVPLSTSGPGVVFDHRRRFVAVSGQVQVAQGRLGYGIPAKYLLELREKDRASTVPRPIQELAGAEPAWRDPLTPAGSTLCGGILSRAGQHYDGLAYLQRAVDEGNTPESYYEIGIANSYLQQRNESLAAFSRAAEMRPCFVRALINSGAENFMMGQFAEAESFYVRAQRCDSTFAPVYVNLGGVQYVQGKLGRAERNFRKALGLDPDYDAARLNLGIMLKNKGQIDEARRLLEQMTANGHPLAHKLAEILEGS